MKSSIFSRSALAVCAIAGLVATSATSLPANADVSGGLIVHLDCGTGEATAGLYVPGRSLVRGLDSSAANIVKARAHVQSKGLYGPVSIGQYDRKTLPFIDNSVTVVVAEKPSVPMAEIMRVLHPYGVAIVGGAKTVKPKPASIDEWTHYLRAADNNAVAHDTEIGPPRHMQFLADPLWARHHDRLATISTIVAAKGRMFSIVDNGAVFSPDDKGQWTVTARNAFNGVQLWTKPISSWTDIRRRFRSGPVQLQRLLVTDGDRVFVTLGLGKSISVLDAVTGDESAALDGTANAEEFLLVGDTLFVQIGAEGAEQVLVEQKKPAVDYRRNKLVKAIDTRSGRMLWRWPADGTAEIMPRTLTISGGRVFFQESQQTMCLDASTGQQQWRTSYPVKPEPKPAPQKAGKGKKKRKPSGTRRPGWTFCTMVAQDGVVLSCDGQRLRALAADSGKELWTCAAKTPFGKTPSVDILVVNGLVWTSPGFAEGRDLKTGNVERTNTTRAELVTAGHHHRCYRNKATDRYVIEGYRGLEFHDTQGGDFYRHNWIRGLCQYGIMPANGLLYIPSHNCSCYPEAKLFGMWGLKAAESSVDLSKLTHSPGLEQGPAYGKLKSSALRLATEWPMHRHDPGRTGVSPAQVNAATTAWSAKPGGRLAAPVVAGDTALVASLTTHQVLAYDAATGARKWAFTAGGAVDSSPSVYGNAVLFGCRDGYVYCLRLSDGVLAWRFRAAPLDRSIVSMAQVESLWPVHGSILIEDDTAYFTAGRSTYLDGGIFLYGLDPISGAIKQRGRLDSPQAKATKNSDGVASKRFSQNAVDYKTLGAPDRSDAFSIGEGNISDILLASGGVLYLRHQKLTKDLKPASGFTHHLFSTSRLLDDNESYRAHWFYGNGDFSRLPVAYEWLTRGSYGGFASPLGKFMVYDKTTVWGATWKKLALYRTDITDIDTKLKKDFPKNPAIEHQSLAGELPIHTRAMIKAGDHLYLAGYPADAEPSHQRGVPIPDKGILLRIDPESGQILNQTELPACPRFDGISAAYGKLYLALENGELLCMK